MFLGKDILGPFIDHLDSNDPDTLDLPMSKKKLLPNAPQSAIDAFERYKKLEEEYEDDDYNQWFL